MSDSEFKVDDVRVTWTANFVDYERYVGPSVLRWNDLMKAAGPTLFIVYVGFNTVEGTGPTLLVTLLAALAGGLTLAMTKRLEILGNVSLTKHIRRLISAAINVIELNLEPPIRPPDEYTLFDFRGNPLFAVGNTSQTALGPIIPLSDDEEEVEVLIEEVAVLNGHSEEGAVWDS